MARYRLEISRTAEKQLRKRDAEVGHHRSAVTDHLNVITNWSAEVRRRMQR